jgi:heptosyltransferase II
LLERGYEVILVGSPEDHWVDSSFAGLAVTNLIGTLSLPELIGQFDEMDAVVSHDTGPLHLAGITNAAVIGIFGPTDPWEKQPRREYSVALWGGEGFACRPCYDGKNYAPCQFNGCMHQVNPEMVLQELDGLLERKTLGAPSPVRVVLPDVR